MFQTLEIQNFRCFADLRLEALARVNLIAGRNNAGKTALLEAIRLHCNPANCELAYDLLRKRGIVLSEKDLEGVASWLFLNRDAAKEITLASEDSDTVRRTLTIALLDYSTAKQRYSGESAVLAQQLDPQFSRLAGASIVFRYRSGAEESVSIGIPAVTGGLLYGGGRRVEWSVPNAFLSALCARGEAEVDQFGELESEKRQEEILPALRILEPRLQRLSLIPFAGTPILHGDIGLPRLVPLPLMGEGIRRLLSILLAIATHKGGVVLIDEVENGLHHSVMSKVWQAIGLAARQANVQVFATTHSYECILAAHTAFESAEPYEFAFHRLDRTESGIKPVSYDRESIDYALEMSHEVR